MLAPALFSSVLQSTGFYPAMHVPWAPHAVGSSIFTDQNYADDAVLFSDVAAHPVKLR